MKRAILIALLFPGAASLSVVRRSKVVVDVDDKGEQHIQTQFNPFSSSMSTGSDESKKTSTTTTKKPSNTTTKITSTTTTKMTSTATTTKKATPHTPATGSSCSTELVHWNLCDRIKEVHSNLNGIGPNNTDPNSAKEFRIPEIAKVGDIKVDLVVTVVDGGPNEKYKSSRVEQKKWGGGAYVSKTEAGPNYPVGKADTTTDVWGVGIAPCWIVMPWHTKTHTKFHWGFVKTGTSEAVVPKSFSLRISDFDAQASDTEYVTFHTPPSSIKAGSAVHRTQSGGEEKVSNTKSGLVTDNPTRALKPGCTPTAAKPYMCMTDDHINRSVEVSYKNLGGWEMTFGAVDDAQGDRALQIHGMICQDSTSNPTPAPTPAPTPTGCHCNKVVHWNLCDNIQKVHSNLDGVGPNNSDANSAKEFRVPEIAKVCGTKVDLLVTVVDGGPDNKYKSQRVEEKKWGGGAYVSKTEAGPNYPVAKADTTTDVWGVGIAPCWIVMPWHTKTHTKFHWGFVKTGTYEAVTPDNFSLRIADFDAQASDTEYVTFHTTPSTITPGSAVRRIQVTTVGGEERISNTVSGDLTDNPTRALKSGCTPTAAEPYLCMTDDHKARSVEVSYQNLSAWEMTFGAVDDAQGDRALQIHGHICES